MGVNRACAIAAPNPYPPPPHKGGGLLHPRQERRDDRLPRRHAGGGIDQHVAVVADRRQQVELGVSAARAEGLRQAFGEAE